MSETYAEQNKNNEQQPYYDIETLLSMIEGENGEACRRIYEDHGDRFRKSPGSRKNHQAWLGGYIDHVTDAMNLGSTFYDTLNNRRELPFSKSDVLLIVYLHDFEKPFLYQVNEDGSFTTNPDLVEKSARETFKRDLINQYGIKLNARQDNALEFVEGIRDYKYSNTSRVMGELAVVCHMADLASARLWYNHPLAQDDPWSGSQCQNPAAKDVWLASEFTD